MYSLRDSLIILRGGLSPPGFEVRGARVPPVPVVPTVMILRVLRLSVVYESINIHLGESQDLIMSIQIYLKYKYTYENARFCILCIDDFKISKIFQNCRNFPRFPPPPPPPPPQCHAISDNQAIMYYLK